VTVEELRAALVRARGAAVATCLALLDDAAQQLTATEHGTVRLIGIEAAGGHPSCVVFLAPDEPTVIASLAVLGPVPPA